MNDRNNGIERAALLLDEKGQLVAVGLVNGHCTVKSREESLSCNDLTDTVLTIFQPKGANKDDAASLVTWSKQLPPMQAILAESDNPETRANVQKIATVEYVSTDPKKRHGALHSFLPTFPNSCFRCFPSKLI